MNDYGNASSKAEQGASSRVAQMVITQERPKAKPQEKTSESNMGLSGDEQPNGVRLVAESMVDAVGIEPATCRLRVGRKPFPIYCL